MASWSRHPGPGQRYKHGWVPVGAAIVTGKERAKRTGLDVHLSPAPSGKGTKVSHSKPSGPHVTVKPDGKLVRGGEKKAPKAASDFEKRRAQSQSQDAIKRAHGVAQKAGKSVYVTHTKSGPKLGHTKPKGPHVEITRQGKQISRRNG